MNTSHPRIAARMADIAPFHVMDILARARQMEGLQVVPLSEFGGEHTALVCWQPGTRFQPHRHYGGEEILVLKGVFQDEFGDYGPGMWLRSPHLSMHQPFSEPGCTILVKVGHLDVAT